jgi:hypothetical protein
LGQRGSAIEEYLGVVLGQQGTEAQFGRSYTIETTSDDRRGGAANSRAGGKKDDGFDVLSDDSFDDNPCERRRTSTNARFDNMASLSGFLNTSELLRTYKFGLWL